MTPKFSVGEVVILQSKNHQECNGEYSVTEIWPPDGERKNPDKVTISTTYGYSLSCDEVDSKSCWAESTLRKKHQPGEHSFTELMASLNSPLATKAPL
jgi:hypothetical protein